MPAGFFGEQVSITPGFVDPKSETSICKFLDNKERCKDDVFLMSFRDLGCSLGAIWGFIISLKDTSTRSVEEPGSKLAI